MLKSPALKSWQDVSSRIVAEKGGGGGGPPEDPQVPDASTTYHVALETKVFEPMLQELSALEESLSGSESEAVAEYRTEIARFARATADRVASAG